MLYLSSSFLNIWFVMHGFDAMVWWVCQVDISVDWESGDGGKLRMNRGCWDLGKGFFSSLGRETWVVGFDDDGLVFLGIWALGVLGLGIPRPGCIDDGHRGPRALLFMGCGKKVSLSQSCGICVWFTGDDGLVCDARDGGNDQGVVHDVAPRVSSVPVSFTAGLAVPLV
ncbi:hypothetical protein BDP81DRAFT_87112 [Colletotrichum phormii]|uniref:Uncharacterized protein n=1 Tax=Colletotrichum phormii TaxID=359342 RepID=A0AAJ0EIY2_9PEZI|nr:uncharacterized protein BDP81DRAFT_87112 [Colletotrichum phormii]KAK1654690.1 hypothetical protein BDP81DRAFT_87112 [Colletotrichum phormii]